MEYCRSGELHEAFSSALVKCIRRWLEPQLFADQALIILFRLGSPDAFRTRLLNELSSLANLSLLAGCNPSVIAAFAPTEPENGGRYTDDDSTLAATDTEEDCAGIETCFLASVDWRLTATRETLPSINQDPYVQIRDLFLDEVAESDAEPVLATAVRHLVEALEGRASLRLDLQPALQLLNDSRKELCLSLAQLEPESRGFRAIHTGGADMLVFGCGTGSHWSGCESIIEARLEPGWPDCLLLEWRVDCSMQLELEIRTPGSPKGLSYHRQLPRPLLIQINRLGQRDLEPSTAETSSSKPDPGFFPDQGEAYVSSR